MKKKLTRLIIITLVLVPIVFFVLKQPGHDLDFLEKNPVFFVMWSQQEHDSVLTRPIAERIHSLVLKSIPSNESMSKFIEDEIKLRFYNADSVQLGEIRVVLMRNHHHLVLINDQEYTNTQLIRYLEKDLQLKLTYYPIWD